jgi:hypothetical protein
MSRCEQIRRAALRDWILRLSLLLGMGCTTAGTTVVYPGAERPKEEQASLEADRIVVDSIDDVPLHGKGGSFALLAEPHELSVRFDRWKDGSRIRHDKAGPVTICFVARRGHTYAIRPTLFGAAWGPEIVDKQSGQRVAITNPIDPPLNCRRRRHDSFREFEE